MTINRQIWQVCLYSTSGIKTKYDNRNISSAISSQLISGKTSDCKLKLPWKVSQKICHSAVSKLNCRSSTQHDWCEKLDRNPDWRLVITNCICMHVCMLKFLFHYLFKCGAIINKVFKFQKKKKKKNNSFSFLNCFNFKWNILENVVFFVLCDDLKLSKWRTSKQVSIHKKKQN